MEKAKKSGGHCQRRIFPFLVFILNILIVLAGTSILILGGIIEEKFLHHAEYIANNRQLQVPVIILMVGGGMTIFSSLFGCFGAISVKRSVLNLYASMLLLAASLQLAGSISTFVRRPAFPEWIDNLQEEMRKMLLHYPVEPNDATTERRLAKSFWDVTQKHFGCCGIRSRMDWNVYKPGLSRLPESCKCDLASVCETGGFFWNGCYSKVLLSLESLYDLQTALAWTGIGCASAEIVFGLAVIIFVNSKKGIQVLSP